MLVSIRQVIGCEDCVPNDLRPTFRPGLRLA